MSNEKWYIRAKKADFNKIAQRYHIDPVVARLLRNRDLTSWEEMDRYLNAGPESFYDPLLLTDIRKGAELILEKIRKKEKIRVIGDYDVDGVCSSYILLTGLRRAGAEADVRIPHRIRDGYGLNDRMIREAAMEKIHTIITCDNGIAAKDAVILAKDLGMDVVVTDHHEVPYEVKDGGKKYFLPPAEAVIDPKRPEDPYPFREICGAVVAWKFIQVLYDLCGIPRKESMQFLEFAALATNCDVMPLLDENRIIEKEGLKQITHTENIGLSALVEACGLSGKRMTGMAFGFILGPCINAAGRLSDATQALDLFLCQDRGAAERKAKELVSLNEERKKMTEEGEGLAIRYLTEKGCLEDPVLVVYLPSLHESVAGIVAGRLKEDFHRPVFVLTKGQDGNLKGSGRSIDEYSMFDGLISCDDLLLKYGGHRLAAGLSLEEKNLEPFRERVIRQSGLDQDDLTGKVHIDMQLPLWYLTPNLVEQFSLLEPFGTANPSPLFAEKDLTLTGMKKIGKEGQYLSFVLRDRQGTEMRAVYFGNGARFIEEAEAVFGTKTVDHLRKGSAPENEFHMDICYVPEINRWKGDQNIELRIKNYRFRKE